MTVTADDRFEVSITIQVTNKQTGNVVTETKHTDFELNYGAMQVFRETVIGALNSETGKLGGALAESFGQGGARQLLSGVVNKVVDRVTDQVIPPGVMR